MKMNMIHNGRKGIIKIVAVVLLLCFTGCLSLTRFGLNNAEPVYDELIRVMLNFPNAEATIEGMPGMALMCGALAELSPESAKLNSLASISYGMWGWLIEDERKEFALQLYDIGIGYGVRAVKALDDDIKEGMESKEDKKNLVDFVDEIEEDNMDIFFFCILNMGLKMLADSENPYALIHIGDVIRIMERIGEIDESYFFYVPIFFDAGFKAMGGGFMGITMDQANKIFEEGFDKTNKHMLLGYWLYARLYAVTIMDEELFEKTIDYILETPSEVLPGGRLVNEVAKVKAKALRKNKSKYF